MKIRVYYEDTDIGGIVYHANYLKFCERARSELFFQKNKNPYDSDGHFVLRHMSCDYFSPATIGDVIEVKTETKEIKGAKITLVQSIFLEEKKIFEVELLLIYLNEAFKPTKIPESIKEILLY